MAREIETYLSRDMDVEPALKDIFEQRLKQNRERREAHQRKLADARAVLVDLRAEVLSEESYWAAYDVVIEEDGPEVVFRRGTVELRVTVDETGAFALTDSSKASLASDAQTFIFRDEGSLRQYLAEALADA